MTEKVLSSDCEDRAGCLLDTLTPSKVILCTQVGVVGRRDFSGLAVGYVRKNVDTG